MPIVVPVLPDAEGKPTIVPINLEKDSGVSIDQIQEELDKQNKGLKVWDVNNERNPRYPEGDNRTRETFTYSHYHHPKGALLAGIKGKILIESINFAHKILQKKYDKDAFVFDDPRLKEDNEYFRKCIKEDFESVLAKSHEPADKFDFMYKLCDIIMFLRKEDIFYGSRFMKMFRDMPKHELTAAEQENLDKWSR